MNDDMASKSDKDKPAAASTNPNEAPTARIEHEPGIVDAERPESTPQGGVHAELAALREECAAIRKATADVDEVVLAKLDELAKRIDAIAAAAPAPRGGPQRPTIGRVVHVRLADEHVTLAAFVVEVHNPTRIVAAVFCPRHGVIFRECVQVDDVTRCATANDSSHRWCWPRIGG